MTSKSTTKKSAKKSSGGGSASQKAPTKKPATKAATTKSPSKQPAPKAAKKSAPSKAPAPPPIEASAAPEAIEGETEPMPVAKGGAPSGPAQQILSAEAPAPMMAAQGELMLDERSTAATQAARIVHEVLLVRPELVVPLVDKFAKGITSVNKRVVQTSADALPAIARIAPARVARHLDLLKNSFEPASDVGRDGLVRTFAALCTASVAYQKRLEPVLTRALDVAEGKALLKWTETVLPALKGEPHARARAVVEGRLYRIPRAMAQQVADFLGIKLRARF